jgi:tRNA-(ms[2]io[6]A)-hydroxylase
MNTNTAPRIKFIKQPTSTAWLEQALANLDTILLIILTVNAKQPESL